MSHVTPLGENSGILAGFWTSPNLPFFLAHFSLYSFTGSMGGLGDPDTPPFPGSTCAVTFWAAPSRSSHLAASHLDSSPGQFLSLLTIAQPLAPAGR